MVEVKHSVAEEALQRLGKERKAYENELATLKRKLDAMSETTDKYERRLIEDQIKETLKVLEMVDKQVLKFSYSQGEK
ncbi:uncharacterized protein Eint_041615 [Encephalitozoon intestinalis ATCC 50506]|uniref:Uncharacterized protein n=1 Tax=Encephalitozoon intestinalis (strain ATCC 50506) TaxID=876142 RepID=W8PGN8_ENCIT|nr:uncharacterized protein Eint_041615 [Encephalitozoon intestinalis ATCC 50506]AHL30096.1 hypothetical protein Eint_041615 [Encephalitozoon intestinalis ATCC 50506]UTX45145.1 hypothetical protein GPK93_04g06850 [Encephalitozoon intestinalis]